MDDNRSKLIEMFKKKHTAYKEFFDSENGKIILDDLEKEYHINKSSIKSMQSIDPIVIACAEAQRAVVLRIKNLADPKQLGQIINPMNEKETQ